MPSKPTRQAQPASVARVPQGRKLAGNLGPGMLYPGVGRLVQRSGQPHFCGTMTGQAFGYTEHPNTKDPKRTSTRFAGQFMLTTHKGEVLQGVECYLPSTLERGLKAAIKLRGDHGEPIGFAGELWCMPDEEGRPASPLGYSYAFYDRVPQGDNNPLMALAYAAGIIERPSPALPAPSEPLPEDVDPETGEIRDPALTASHAA